MARARRKKKIDTWKTKKTYDIIAPSMFEGRKIAETVASDPKHLLGRTITVTMRELAGDFSKQHIKVQFQINDVKGNQAFTRFKGQALSRDYMRSQIRRKTTRVEAVIDVKTKDGHSLRVKVIGLAIGRAQTSQERLIRKQMTELVKEAAQKSDLDQFVQDAVKGKISISLYRKLNKIYPLKRVEVRKIKVLESHKAAA
ncbi:MAG: 30S ribosomal protein S3ae [Euryarchaeota archaeon]|nr:30S ribosomal protein S3ae [Euryarchaeota archaeon]